MKAPTGDGTSRPYRDDSGEFYKVVRLKTGEAILCSMGSDVKSIAPEIYLTLRNPVQAVLSKQMSKGEDIVGEIFMLRPWVGLSKSDEFVIPVDIVLTVGELKRVVKEQYINYLNETKKAEEILQREEEEEKVDKAIFSLLSQVNKGRKVFILNDENEV